MLIINANITSMDCSDELYVKGEYYSKCYDHGFLHIDKESGLITAIGTMDSVIPIDEDVIDAGGNYLYPGFIDAHCHIGMYGDGLGFEADDTNEETDPITPQLSAVDAVNPFDRCFAEAAEGGITTVLTGPGSANPIAGQWLAMKTCGEKEPVIDRLLIKRYVGMKFALGENPKTSYNQKNQAPVTRMATASLIREQLIKAKHYLSEIELAAEDTEMDEPEYDSKCEALLPVLKREAKAFFHAHRADDICTALRISREFNLDCVIVHGTEGYKLPETLANANVPVITGPIMSDRSKPELRALTTKNSGILQEAGVQVAICTDHPETPIQYLPFTAAIAVKAGMNEKAALGAITITAAKIAGIADRVGSLEVGKDGDCVLLSGNPLDICSRVLLTVVSGKICYIKEDETSATPSML